MVDAIYPVDKQCPLCGKKFVATKVRSRLAFIRQDRDFCTYYKDINPYYYGVWVCPHCGYAASDTYFMELPEHSKELLHKFLDGKEITVDFSGERTREQAIATYKLAIYMGDIVSLAASKIAGLYLKLAWLYREAKMEAEEQQALLKARELYDSALMREPLPIGNMTEFALEYLLGILYFETNDYDHALTYFSRIVGNPKARLEKRVLSLARDAWHEVRDLKQKKAAAEAAAGEAEAAANAAEQ